MLNSSNYIANDGALNTGEQLAPDLDLSDPDTKVYYHQVKGARTHMPDGMEISFRGGMYATKHPEVKAFLDRIADRQGSMVFTKTNAHIVKEIAVTQSDAKAPAGVARVLGKGDSGVLVSQVNPLDDTPKK